ncbi:Gfo/Idh/MocA family oxidoreductase (plasmid) [Haloferax sp. S1W]|uniref:Gfo/Idh/MocA family oxidoreductase n=1 Tax=Haloferax sp. S1W TaxID=3377110 RepID=UPI0037C90416
MRLDVGVIGVGSMGKNHTRVYNELRSANLVGVADTDTERAELVASEFEVGAYSVDELLARVDAVSVVVPTEYHYPVVEQCIDAGVHVLVEKPFVASIERGQKLLDHATENDVTIQVGHIERFNPAVTELSRILDGAPLIALESRRLGPLPSDARNLDNVILDLMIHDIDVIQSLVPDPVVDVFAVEAVNGQHATANLVFANGTTASLTASRVTQQKVRELTVTTEDRYIELDYTKQSIAIHRQSRPEYQEVDGNLSYHHAGITERPLVQTGEPLKLELESFIETVVDGDTPRVTGEDGLRAVGLANAISQYSNRSGSVRSTQEPVFQPTEVS